MFDLISTHDIQQTKIERLPLLYQKREVVLKIRPVLNLVVIKI